MNEVTFDQRILYYQEIHNINIFATSAMISKDIEQWRMALQALYAKIAPFLNSESKLDRKSVLEETKNLIYNASFSRLHRKVREGSFVLQAETLSYQRQFNLIFDKLSDLSVDFHSDMKELGMSLPIKKKPGRAVVGQQ